MWQAIEAGTRRVVLGDFSESGRAEIQLITGDIVAQLRDAPDRRLMFTYIEPAAICVLDAARSETCIRSKAERLRGAVVDAYARSACLWAENNCQQHKEQDAAFASALLRWAAAGDAQYIVEIATKMSNSSGAFADYLDALVMASTYETVFVPILSSVWPQLMHIGLTPPGPQEPERRYPAARRIDSLMPDPRTSGYFLDPEPVLQNARAHWFSTDSVLPHLEKWLGRAHADMHSIDALVGFLETRPVREQVWPGLDWIRRVVIDEDRTAAACGFRLVGWLRRIRASVFEDSAKRCYREVVDALVPGNFSGARDLQGLDE
jgi:hypothetical protein